MKKWVFLLALPYVVTPCEYSTCWQVSDSSGNVVGPGSSSKDAMSDFAESLNEAHERRINPNPVTVMPMIYSQEAPVIPSGSGRNGL